MTHPQEQHSKQTQVRIWNIPVRLFHWTLVGCFITAWLTRDNRYLDIHIFAGYLMAGLITFRLLWGFIGGPYARFRDFAFGWQEVSDYLKGVLNRKPSRFLGHNPAGSWAIYLLLTLGVLIIISGLLGFGGEERQGPFAGWLTFPQGKMLQDLHELLAWFMLGLVCIHLIGVLVESLLHKESLVKAMLTGYKPAAAGTTAASSQWQVSIIMVLLILGGGFIWFKGYLTATPEQPYRPFVGPALPDNELWRAECGSCHLAFHPSLLPARSWKAIMEEQASHFKEDLFLEPDTVSEIEEFLVANAAENELTEPAWKINSSIPKSETLLRITESPYWLKKHQEISDAVWKDPKVNGKINCAACHLDADAGTFEDAAMRLPTDAQ